MQQKYSPLLRHGSKLTRLLDDMVNGHRRVPEPPSSNSQTSTSGFPLGAALVLLIVCGLSMFLSCCCHWRRIRRHTSRLLRNSSEVPAAPSNLEINSEEVSLENSLVPAKHCENLKPALTLPVLMPGDDFPRYLAWPTAGAEGSPSLEESKTSNGIFK